MSEKRSWDIQPKQKSAPIQRPAPQAPRPAPSTRPRLTTRATPPEIKKPVVVKAPRREKVLQGREREPLKDRRRRARRRGALIFFMLAILILVGIFVCIWLPAFRIQHVEAAGPDSDGAQTVALASLSGNIDYVLPRNSIFFFPEESIRANILQQYPDLSAIAISRTSFDSIALASVPRTQFFIWCGTNYTPDQAPIPTQNASSTAPVIPAPATSCYSVDGQGVLFATVPEEMASTTDSLIAYAPITSPTTATNNQAPLLGSTISQASVIPTTIEFIKVMKSLNAAITIFVIRGDEVDLYTQGGTRITYVLGREDMAKELAESAFSSLNLNDGSLQYVDLRFDGKVYFKKVGTDTQTTSTASN